MISAVREPAAADVRLAYHLLRAAVNTFGRSPGDLKPEEYRRAKRLASQSRDLEAQVLLSPEAVGVCTALREVDSAFAQVASRYADAQELAQDLRRNGLREGDLREALRRELLFDTIMTRVGTRATPVTEVDVELFYEMHLERFETAEKRHARHILITVNERIPENTASAARARIERLAQILQGQTERFAKLARQHSECPTALEGGRLGAVERGQLYPQLDDALFALQSGEVSGVLRSELGYHLLLCEGIDMARQLPLSQVRERIRTTLDARNRHACQKAWLAELCPGTAPG